MEEFTTIIQILRDDLMEKYRHLQNNLEIDDEDYENSIDAFYDAIDQNYENSIEALDEYYNTELNEEEKEKNKKLLELTNNTKYINKFKIHILDDIQRQYTKTRKIY